MIFSRISHLLQAGKWGVSEKNIKDCTNMQSAIAMQYYIWKNMQCTSPDQGISSTHWGVCCYLLPPPPPPKSASSWQYTYICICCTVYVRHILYAYTWLHDLSTSLSSSLVLIIFLFYFIPPEFLSDNDMFIYFELNFLIHFVRKLLQWRKEIRIVLPKSRHFNTNSTRWNI